MDYIFYNYICCLGKGETGCGKTTQIPQYIHEAQPQMRGLIGCTQPRRVAAITVAQRVAQETKTQLGTLTGSICAFDSYFGLRFDFSLQFFLDLPCFVRNLKFKDH